MQFKCEPPKESPGEPLSKDEWHRLGELCFGHLLEPFKDYEEEGEGEGESDEEISDEDP